MVLFINNYYKNITILLKDCEYYWHERIIILL
mgnify:CR=1 FL=1